MADPDLRAPGEVNSDGSRNEPSGRERHRQAELAGRHVPMVNPRGPEDGADRVQVAEAPLSMRLDGFPLAELVPRLDEHDLPAAGHRVAIREAAGPLQHVLEPGGRAASTHEGGRPLPGPGVPA